MINKETSLNKIFVSERGFLSETRTEEHIIISRDISSIEFIIEELISNAAYEIFFDSWGKERDDILLDNLANPLKRHVKFIDDSTSVRTTDIIMSPVFEEYNIQIQHEGHALVYNNYKLLSEDISDATAQCWVLLREFMTGIQHGLQIDIDIQSFKKHVSVIRQSSRNPVSRYNMSVIEGILKCYKPITVDNLIMVPATSKNHINMFIDFLEDTNFLALSQAHSKLGMPKFLSKSLKDIKQITRHILSNDKFKPMFDNSTKLITAATKVPLPSAELVSTLAIVDYLPVIVNIQPLMTKARKAWLQLRGADIVAKYWGKYSLQE